MTMKGPIKILDAPVHLGSLAETMSESKSEANSIWIDRRDKESVKHLDTPNSIPSHFNSKLISFYPRYIMYFN